MVMTTGAYAQKAKKPVGESLLVGVRLYDTGVRIVSIYGSPDEILAVTVGSSATGGGSGGPGFPGGGGRGGPGFGGPGAGGGGNSSASGADFDQPFTFGNEMLRQGFGPPGGGPPQGFGPPPGAGGPPGGGGGGRIGGPGGGGGFPGGGGGVPNGGGGSATEATYTRWVYNRNNSKYGFVLDKFGRVVQIEAIGIQNPKVKTKKGIGFGNTFAQVVKQYGTPDGYEIAGDSIVLRYLTRQKVAFRLSRMADKKPHVVTGVVVAAGKR